MEVLLIALWQSAQTNIKGYRIAEVQNLGKFVVLWADNLLGDDVEYVGTSDSFIGAVNLLIDHITG